jgi:hypothetical protein
VKKDFKDLPNQINFESKDTRWCWGIGGHGLNDNQYHIDYINDDYSEDIYVLPDYLNYMIKYMRNIGRNEKLQEIRDSLELD